MSISWPCLTCDNSLACSHISPCHPCCHCTLWSLLVFSTRAGLFFIGPSGADIFRVFAMYSGSHQHWLVVKPFCDCQPRTLSDHWHTDAPLPYFRNCLSPSSWHAFGTLFFIMVPVAGRPFASNASMRSIVVKYQSKNRWLPVGTDSTMHRTAAALTPNLWFMNVFFPWYTSKSSIRPFEEARTKNFRPVGFDLPGTYCLTGQRPVNGMICSSMQTFSVFGSLRQPCLTQSSNGLTLQRMSAFFVSSITARSTTILSELLSLKNLSLAILLHITGTFVFWPKTFWFWDSLGRPCGLKCWRRS